MHTEQAYELLEQWTNGNREDVVADIASDPDQAVLAAEFVLLLCEQLGTGPDGETIHDNHEAVFAFLKLLREEVKKARATDEALGKATVLACCLASDRSPFAPDAADLVVLLRKKAPQ